MATPLNRSRNDMKTGNDASLARLAWWFMLPGVLLLLGTATLAARLIWEMTALSWTQGPQMVGFALAHGHGLAFLLLFPPLLMLWTLIAGLYLGWKLWNRHRISLLSAQAIVSALTLFVGLTLPQGFWIRLFIDRFASGPHASEFLIHAAATGDLRTVKKLLDHGVPVDARDREKKTALHGAAVEGEVDVISYLIKHGANVNAVSLWGSSPLEEAISMGRTEAAKFLEAHGAVRIRGTEEQRSKAAEAIVREDIERMERLHPIPKSLEKRP